MKAQKFFSLLASLGLFVFLIPTSAQTYNQDLYATITDAPIFCLSNAEGQPTLTGYWVYHISYHVDKKTQEVSRIHWNIKQSHLEDQDGNTYKLVDTGNDNFGGPVPGLGGISSYDLWNNINAINEGYDIDYNVDDGWIAFPNTTSYVGNVTSTFKVIGNGMNLTFKEVMVYHINGKGEVTVDFDKIVYDCN